MTTGLALAVGSALGTNVAFLFKQRGAVRALRCRDVIRYAAPWACSALAGSCWGGPWRWLRWGLHAGGLALAPLWVVQAVLSGGLVFPGALAERYFDFHLGQRQWAGVIVTALGLAMIAVTGGSHTSAVRHYSLAARIAVECGVFALGAGLIRISMRRNHGPAATGTAARRCGRRALRGVRHRPEVPHRSLRRGAAGDRPASGPRRRWRRRC